MTKEKRFLHTEVSTQVRQNARRINPPKCEADKPAKKMVGKQEFCL
jgi:hypothetical protein